MTDLENICLWCDSTNGGVSSKKLEILCLQEHGIESEVEEDKIQGKILVLIIKSEGETEYAYGRM